MCLNRGFKGLYVLKRGLRILIRATKVPYLVSFSTRGDKDGVVAGQGNGGDKHNGKEVKFHGNLPSSETTGLAADYKVIPHLIYEVSVFKLQPPLKCPGSETTEKFE